MSDEVLGRLEQLFDVLPVGLLLVDAVGRVVYANRVGRDLARRGIFMANGGWKLEDFLKAQRDLPSVQRAECDGRSSHLSFTSMGDWTAVAIWCTPELGEEFDQTLRDVYSLTPQERRLAHALSEGHPLSEAAEAIGIELSTARSHLKNVFGKMQTRRQTDLAVLLASCALAAAATSEPARSDEEYAQLAAITR
ncbi:MAG: helix-turn-helix transcriptional regulator [Thermoanaerobaculia bacterium]|nr:helix-turn-helix transcriptional regulator [Thermoanaerobaculia bacterium]